MKKTKPTTRLPKRAPKEPKRRYICPTPDGSNFRDCTPTEIGEALHIRKEHDLWQAEIEKLEKKIEKGQRACKHTVCYDEEGFTYQPRCCVICGVIDLF